jgi:lipooligosaccharide transport system ATP-binding protein
MDSGRTVAEGAPAELVRRYVGAEVVEIPVGPVQEDHERVMSALRQRGLEPEDDGERVVVYGENGAAGLDELEYPDLTRRPANLEDVFLHLTGRGLYEE